MPSTSTTRTGAPKKTWQRSSTWNWDGNETEILSRCTDELGQVQPTRAQIAKYWNKPYDQTFTVPGLDNSAQPWHIASDGSVTNGFA